MNHDQLFKEVLYAFLGDFLRLFLPEQAARLDLSSIRFLPQEVFTDTHSGSLRRVDVVASVTSTEGRVELILVHVEVQSEREGDMGFRMWEYYHLLRLRHRLKVLPVVLYLAPGAGGIVAERYNEEVLGLRVEQFEYTAVGLPDLDSAAYDASSIPLGPALAALMRAPQGADPAARKFDLLLRAIRGEVNEARRLTLATVIERYTPLASADSDRFFARLTQDRSDEVKEVMSIYSLIREDGVQEGLARGVQQGVQQGVAAGVIQGQQRTLLRQLRAKFGELPPHVIRQVESVNDSDVLDSLSDRVLTATSIEEMGLTD